MRTLCRANNRYNQFSICSWPDFHIDTLNEVKKITTSNSNEAKTTSSSSSSNNPTTLGNVLTSARETCTRNVGDALSMTKTFDVGVTGRTFPVEVVHGRGVSEETWAEFKASRRVTFNPRVEGKLVASIPECYPTRARIATCFFLPYQTARAKRDILRGQGKVEWETLRAEILQEAEDRRKEGSMPVLDEEQHEDDAEEEQ